MSAQPHTDIAPNAVKDIAGALTALVADVFTVYVKTKNFHWHMSGPHFRDYHLLLDEHGGLPILWNPTEPGRQWEVSAVEVAARGGGNAAPAPLAIQQPTVTQREPVAGSAPAEGR